MKPEAPPSIHPSARPVPGVGPLFATSKDGTRIAYDREGSGPPLVVVMGAMGYRAFPYSKQLAAELGKHFTVHMYDRRGRGDSGDTAPFAVQREVEDLAAVIDAAGGDAFVVGTSSGAALALEAAAAGVPMRKLVAFEPPYVVGLDAKGPVPPADFEAQLQRLIQRDRRDDAVKLFMRTVGVPGVVVFVMRFFPFWKGLRSTAHTLPYDAAIMVDFRVPAQRLSRIRAPTLALYGGKSPPTLQEATKAIAQAVPGSIVQSIPGQNHGVKPAALAPVLKEFFGRKA